MLNDVAPDALLEKAMLDRELDKAEKIKPDNSIRYWQVSIISQKTLGPISLRGDDRGISSVLIPMVRGLYAMLD
jgi:hypothetical protein